MTARAEGERRCRQMQATEPRQRGRRTGLAVIAVIIGRNHASGPEEDATKMTFRGAHCSGEDRVSREGSVVCRGVHVRR